MVKKVLASGMVMGLLMSMMLAAKPANAREMYPNLDKAIRALRAAEGDLNRAPHDFGGHKADALAACEEAIKQLQLAKQFRNDVKALHKNESEQGH